MTFELDRETREWLRSATAAEPPLSRAHGERIKASLAAKVAAGVVLPTATAKAAGLSAWLGKSTLLWLLGGAGVGVALVGSLELTEAREAHPVRSAPAMVAKDRTIREVAVPPSATLNRVASEPAARSIATTAPTPPRVARSELARPSDAPTRTAPPRAAPLDVPVTPSSSTNRGLRAELDLMNALQTALRDRAPQRAELLIREHATRFPNGQLRLERLAAEVFTACELGDRERAQRTATSYLAIDASSALAKRVRASCVFFP